MVKNRCAFDNCKNKIKNIDKIIGKCRCDKIFCHIHRLPETHDCSYNYSNDFNAKKFIEDNKCITQKIIKIN